MLRWLLHKLLPRQEPYIGIDCDELPENLSVKRVYIVGETKSKWVAAMICPCGCKDMIQLNLLKEARPRWKIRFNKKKRVTVIPSIWRTTGCRSHFNLINGIVHWH